MLELAKKFVYSAPSHRSILLDNLGVEHFFGGVDHSPPKNTLHAKQVHGIACVESTMLLDQVSKSEGKLPGPSVEADCVYTFTKKNPIGVRTADCLPVLFHGENWVAAAHAGWRGLTKGVLVEALKTRKGLASKITVAIGPAILQPSFEVGFEVVEALSSLTLGLSENQFHLCVSKGLADRWHIDMQLAAAFCLANAGVNPSKIEIIRACTKQSPGQWHSYRREGSGVRSNWSWIHL